MLAWNPTDHLHYTISDLCSAMETGMCLRDLLPSPRCSIYHFPRCHCRHLTSCVLASYCTETHQLAPCIQQPQWAYGSPRRQWEGTHFIPTAVLLSFCDAGSSSSLQFQDQSQAKNPWVFLHLFLLTSIKLRDISRVIRLAHPEAGTKTAKTMKVLSQ